MIFGKTISEIEKEIAVLKCKGCKCGYEDHYYPWKIKECRFKPDNKLLYNKLTATLTALKEKSKQVQDILDNFGNFKCGWGYVCDRIDREELKTQLEKL